MRKYFIRTERTEGLARLYTRVQKRTPSINLLLAIDVEVDVAKWNKSFQELSIYARTPEGKRVERMVQDVDRAIDDVVSREEFSRGDIEEAVASVVHREAREARAREEERRRKAAELRAEEARLAKAKEEADVRRYLARLIDGMRNGSVRIEGKGRNKGERYTPNTIKMWRSLQGIIERFYQEYPFTWNSIDKRFAVRFRAWMEDEGYMAKSINKYVGQFVALINRAQSEGLHTNTAAAGLFLKPAVEETQKATEIYLTAEELNALYQMPLNGEKALVRDIFIVGCCTCQRVSDYSRLRRENFVTTARGTKVVKIQQKKTHNYVTIPILDDKLIEIMKRYDYSLPQLPANFDVILNRYIKEVCRELSESVPTLAQEMPTILTMKERAKEERGVVTFKRDENGRVVKPRYELVTSHTARRTGITLLYLSGKFDVYQMMHVSGHKEAKTFREYIKLSSDEMAEQIAAKLGEDTIF